LYKRGKISNVNSLITEAVSFFKEALTYTDDSDPRLAYLPEEERSWKIKAFQCLGDSLAIFTAIGEYEILLELIRGELRAKKK